ncbi:MAG: NF038122 family metalloprotease [Alphaproteobacteria bacterium]|nr:NF038122 family metalloprotease [Alphaproteobacteria bacterium]
MKINVTYDTASVNIPAAFKAAVDTAVSLLDSLFMANVTLNIQVGWGTVAGQALGAGALGESSTSLIGSTFAATKAALLAVDSAWHSDNPSLIPQLPASFIPGATIGIPTAEAKALGLSTSTGLDGSIGVSNTVNWAFNENGTISAGQYDLVSVLLHEFTEVMGRISDLNVDGFYTPMDLFRYSAPGVLSTATGGTGSTAYFSTDGGVTKLATWNNNPANGDTGDWYPGNGNDPFNDYGTTGQFERLTAADLTNMDVLGYNTLKYNVTVQDKATSGYLSIPVTLYNGPVAGLNFQYIYTGTSSYRVYANADNQFIHTGSGDDRIDFSAVHGNNVLDGGTGSNFLVGSADLNSHDTFFVDDRNLTANVWSTAVNFHKGDAVTVWGVTPTSAAISWVDGQGATGYQGLTLHVLTPGMPAAYLTLAGFTTADLTNGHLTLTYGTSNGTPYLYIVDNY